MGITCVVLALSASVAHLAHLRDVGVGWCMAVPIGPFRRLPDQACGSLFPCPSVRVFCATTRRGIEGCEDIRDETWLLFKTWKSRIISVGG